MGRGKKQQRERDDLLILVGCDEREMMQLKLFTSLELDKLGAFTSDYETIESMMRLPEASEVRSFLRNLVAEERRKEADELATEFLKRRAVMLGVPAEEGEAKGEAMEFLKPQKSRSRPKQPKQKKKKAPKEAAAERTGEQCYCLATEHDLVGNCLQCGKIICEFEGRGPCTFCGAAFVSLSSGGAEPDAGMRDAVARRDRLLAYEASKAARSSILDDQADYFNTETQWISSEERKAIKQLEKTRRAEQKRPNVKVSFDFAGRRLVVDDTPRNIYEPFKLSELMGKKSPSQDVAKMLENREAPRYVSSSPTAAPKTASNPNSYAKRVTRVQDDYFAVDEDQQEEGEDKDPSFPLCMGLFLSEGAAPVANTAVFCHEVREGVEPFYHWVDGLDGESSCARVCLDFARAPTLLTPEQKKQLKVTSVAQLHAGRVTEATCMIRPLYNDSMGLAKVPSHARKYWNELQQIVSRNVSFVCAPHELQHALTLFPKRSMVVLDERRPKLLEPFTGHTGLLAAKGYVVRVSAERPYWQETAMEWMRDPYGYEARAAMTRAMRKREPASELEHCELLSRLLSPLDHLEQLQAKKKLQQRSFLLKARAALARKPVSAEASALVERKLKEMDLADLVARKPSVAHLTKQERKKRIRALKSELEGSKQSH